jgi:methionine synthase II (cobalamin-independent)
MRRNSKPLTAKEDFINDMIQDAIEHTPNFDVGRISNGDYTFNDFIRYFKNYDNFERFKEFTEKNNLVIHTEVTSLKEETHENYLPFAEKEFDK